MSQELKARLFGELESIVLIDPHTHINPHSPASKTLADILGYHYYTELAHSAGLERAKIEEPLREFDIAVALMRHEQRVRRSRAQ